MGESPRVPPRRERLAEPGQRFITVSAGQRDDFIAAFSEKMAEVGLVEGSDVVLRVDPVGRRPSDAETYIAKVTFTAQAATKRAAVMELHDVMDAFEHKEIEY